MTTKTKHTPGPWHIGVRQPTSDKFVFGPKGEEVANCDRLTNYADENLANARLIAAAPDMLAILKEVITQTDMNLINIDHALFQVIKDAISKAEGTL